MEINVGDRFGRLTVLSEAERRHGSRRYVVRCDCGAEKVVFGVGLRRGTTRSCGCLSRELASARMKARHGEVFRTEGMKQCSRCGQLKPLDGFAKDGTAGDGLQHRCRSCQAEARQEAAARRRQHKDDEWMTLVNRARQLGINVDADAYSDRERAAMVGVYRTWSVRAG